MYDFLHKGPLPVILSSTLTYHSTLSTVIPVLWQHVYFYSYESNACYLCDINMFSFAEITSPHSMNCVPMMHHDVI